ncbi:MAG: hypothetical protein QME66_10005 [Candidatus Eisenbacteria bacterium]|nr:hypothetical protein [Candidatus Eisenbacteria bacterium]
MDFISKIITWLLDLLVLPFGKTHHTLGLVWLSLLTGVGMAFVFKLTSNQEKIKKSKDRFKSFILEMRIYQDDLGAIFRAFLNSLKANLAYLRYIVVPFLVIIIPAAIIFMQLDERYGRRYIAPGSTTLVTIRLVRGADPYAVSSSITCSPGVSLDAGPVRIREERELDWRLRVDSSGTHTVTISIDGHEYKIPLVAEPSYRMIGSTRAASSFIESFLHPAFPAIPKNSPIKTVKLRFPGASYPLLFWHVHWILIFLVYSLIGAAVVKFLVGFEI